MKNTARPILLVLMMLVSSSVPAIAQEVPAPDAPEPEAPQPPGETPEPEPPQQPPEPPEEPPQPPQPPTNPDPGTPSPPGEAPQPPSEGLLEDLAEQQGTYYDDGFEDLENWTAVRLAGDQHDATFWNIQNRGRDASPAAVLSTGGSLPRGTHQALVSPRVDLRSVPSATIDPAVGSGVFTGLAAIGQVAGPGTQTADATVPVTPGSQASTSGEDEPLATAGPIKLPSSPSYLSLVHSFNFDDTLNAEGHAVSGFVVEARESNGEWVPLEPAMLVRTVRGTDVPASRAATGSALDGTAAAVYPCAAADVTEEVIRAIVGIGGGGGGSADVPCSQDPIVVEGADSPRSALLDLGNTLTLEAVGGATGSSVPALPNAYIEPLEVRGYTGQTQDNDDDGRPDPVGYVFDLSHWSGKRVELRFRAGTSAVSSVPQGFWAIDRAQVSAGARPADLKLNLTAPGQDHLAPPNKAFPIQAEIQNVGVAPQTGPYDVEFTIRKNGQIVLQETVEVQEDLAFLETTTARLPFTPIAGAPYTVEASLSPGNPDTEPQNDADVGTLAVGTDRSATLKVKPAEPVIEPGDLLNVTVVVEGHSNVPLDDSVQLTAFPYDPVSGQPVARGAQTFSEASLSIPRAESRHPDGAPAPKAAAHFARTLQTEGAYLLVASFGDGIATAPLGVGTAPPPLFEDHAETLRAGASSFELLSETGTWTAKPGSDVLPVPQIVDPGSSDGTAWVPMEYEATVIRPQNDSAIVHADVPLAGAVSEETTSLREDCDSSDGILPGQVCNLLFEEGLSAGARVTLSVDADADASGDQPTAGADATTGCEVRSSIIEVTGEQCRDATATDPVGDTDEDDPDAPPTEQGQSQDTGDFEFEPQGDIVDEFLGNLANAASDTLGDLVDPRQQVVLEGTRGTQRVYALASDVDLSGTDRATLAFRSSLITPPDGHGLTEGRVYISTKQDARSAIEQLTDPDNCPDREACGTVLDSVPLATGPTLRTVDRVVEDTFRLEESLRCGLLVDVFEVYANDTYQDARDNENVPDGVAPEVGGGVLAAGEPATCPADAGGRETSGACQERNDVKRTVVCHPDEPGRLEALLPMLNGDLVHRETQAHTWSSKTIDLSPWAGQNVTVAFVGLSESRHATQTYRAPGVPAVSVATLGYGAPERPKGMFAVDGIRVATDEGLRLSEDATGRIDSEAVNLPQTLQPGVAVPGWRSLGYQHLSNLGDPQMPLRSSAQVYPGDGRPGGSGADEGTGFTLGNRTVGGIELYPSQIPDSMKGTPWDLESPRLDPATTILASPTLDLTGPDAPVFQFSQRFDLSLDRPTGAAPQALFDPPSPETFREALDAVDATTPCDQDPSTPDAWTPNLNVDHLRCLLDVKRAEDAAFSVTEATINEDVAQPPVSAGMFVQVRTWTGDGWSNPEPVEPLDGYRYPVGDAGGFQPTLKYNVSSPDAYPGLTVRTANEVIHGGHPTRLVNVGDTPTGLAADRFVDGMSSFYKVRSEPFYQGQPVWAGDSDVDGDGEPDWVRSQLDLSEWAGERVKLEFVLVARQADLGPSARERQTLDDTQLPRRFTVEPWSLDAFSAVEGGVPGQVSVEEVRWPNADLPLVAPGEDLPVRLTVGSPTGLDEPVHATAALVDAKGCLKGTAVTQATYRDASGRPTAMPAGERLHLPQMVIPGENVEGAGPLELRVRTDVGRTPAPLVPATVTLDTPSDVDRHEITNALDVSEGPVLSVRATDPDCDPQMNVTVVRLDASTADGSSPSSSTDSDEIEFKASGARVVAERHTFGNREQLDLNVNTTGDGTALNVSTREGIPFTGAPLVVGVSQGYDGDADGLALALHDRAPTSTARVEVPTDRIPVGTPVPVTVHPSITVDEASLLAVPMATEDPEPFKVWTGRASAEQAQTATVRIPEVGPHLLLLVGSSNDGTGPQSEQYVLSGTFVTTGQAEPAGDPTRIDNDATVTLSKGTRTQLSIDSVEVTPKTGLSNEPRTIAVTVRNAGNTVLEGTSITVTRDGAPIPFPSLPDVLLPGQTEVVTKQDVEPTNDPSVVIRADVTAGQQIATGTTPMLSLVERGSVRGEDHTAGQGWTASGDSLAFRDPETGKAPRDTISSAPLSGVALTGLADVALNLNHSMDMELGFDGGQATIESDGRRQLFRTEDDAQAMGPYSPIQTEHAFTGNFTQANQPARFNPADMIDAPSTLVDKEAVELFDDPETEALDPDTRLEELSYASEGPGWWMGCQGRTFTDDPAPVHDGISCEFAKPLLPLPSRAVGEGLWYMPPSSLVSPTHEWDVTFGGETHTLSVESATQNLYLEAGSSLVSAAQEANELTLSFDEARLFDAADNEPRLTAQVCARFISWNETGTVDELPDVDGVDPDHALDLGSSERVCSSLTHDADQQRVRGWGGSQLTIQPIPEGDFDTVRLTFALRTDRARTAGAQTVGTGMMGDTSTGTVTDRVQLGERTLGWFIGPVTATAGSQTVGPITPDPDDLDTVDAMFGLTGEEIRALQDEEFDNSQTALTAWRYARVVDQAGALTVNATIDGEPVDSFRSPAINREFPRFTTALGPCQWWRAASNSACGWTQSYAAYGWSGESAALATIPYALGLHCTVPSLPDGYSGLETQAPSVTGADCQPAYQRGIGPQVLSSSTVDRLPPGSPPTNTPRACHAGTDGDAPVGHPVVWRTRCLHVDRVASNGDSDDEGQGLRMATADMNAGGEVTPIDGRGLGLDYRLVVPVDLRYAAADAWAKPQLDVLEAGALDAPLPITAEARVEGATTWEQIPFCVKDRSDTASCNAERTSSKQWLNLTPFRGHQLEVALHVRMPHPTLTPSNPQGGLGTPLSASALSGALSFEGLFLQAKFLRLTNAQLELRAWTDLSNQGQGWTIDDARVFGLPIEANVGIAEITSKLNPERARNPSDPADLPLHVHVDENLTNPEGSGLWMRIPVTITLYNQGQEPIEGLGLAPELQMRQASSPSDPWTAVEDCEVTLREAGNRDASEITSIDMARGTTTTLDTQFVLESGRPYDCFPGQGDANDNGIVDSIDIGPDYTFRLALNLTSVPEADYLAEDNDWTREVRPSPFLAHLSSETEPSPVHAPSLSIATGPDGDDNVTATPTRPGPGQPVRVTAEFALVDETSRSVQTRLELVDPATGEVQRTLKGVEADNPVTTLGPYERTSVQWTLEDVPENVTLARVVVEMLRGEKLVVDRGYTWFADGDIRGLGEGWSAREILYQGSHAYCQTEQDTDGRFKCFPRSESSGPSGQVSVRPEGTGGVSVPVPDLTEVASSDSDDSYQAIFGTPLIQVSEMPPPVFTTRARWDFPSKTAAQEGKRPSVTTGWTMQVCHADVNAENPCSLSSGSGPGWSWNTLRIDAVPERNLGRLPGHIGNPSECSNPAAQSGYTTEECTSASMEWAAMKTSDPVVMGTSPGFSNPVSDPASWTHVAASGTRCQTAAPACPLNWTGGDREHLVRYRIIAFASVEEDITTELWLGDMSLVPSAIGFQTKQDTSKATIPEASPKAIPLDVEFLGQIGANVTPHIQAPPGWDVAFDGIPSDAAVEPGSDVRLTVEAPISPSGSQQSALLAPELEVPFEGGYTASSQVPVGVAAGVHPDLTVEEIRVPSDISQGDAVTVEVVVKNKGLDRSPPVPVTGVAIYPGQSPDLLEPTGEDGDSIDPLFPGQSTSVLLEWTPQSSGTAQLRVAADLDVVSPLTGPAVRPWGLGAVPETRECSPDACNNVAARDTVVAPPTLADLSVDTRVNADTPLTVGEPVDVTVSVENAGPATVPAFEVRLLAGVISLLEDDPLRVTEPLAPGETWTRTVELIPGFNGDLNLVATAFPDERLVTERRGERPDGTPYDANNVESATIPVVARGLSLELPEAVDAAPIQDNGTLEIPVNVTNLGTEPLVASIAPRTEHGLGTLLGPEGEPLGNLELDPGQTRPARLLVIYDRLPAAGRHDVTVEVASQAGQQRHTIQAEVPSVMDMEVDPVTVKADTGKLNLPIMVRATGNVPVTARISLEAPGLRSTTQSIHVDHQGAETIHLAPWIEEAPADVTEGRVVVRSGTIERAAPLRLQAVDGPLATVLDAQVVGGNEPHTQARLANLGDVATQLSVSVQQDDETLATREIVLEANEERTLELDAVPRPGTAQLTVTDASANRTLVRTLDVGQVRPDVKITLMRVQPLAPKEGQTVTVRGTIANEGGSPATLQPGLFVDGVLDQVTPDAETVEPGSVTHVLFEWSATAGDHTLTVSADPGERIDDRSAEDDARARQLSVEDTRTLDRLNEVPWPSAGLMPLVLFALAWVRRDPRE